MPNQNITQRRGGTSSSSGLPITNADIENGSDRKHRKYKFDIQVSPYDRTSIVRWIVVVLLSITVSSFIWKPILTLAGLKPQSIPQHNNQDNSREVIQQSQHVTSHSNNIVHYSRALSQFSELSFALQNSDLVALYFAASWCPMSTPVSIALDRAFGNSNDVLTSEGEGKQLSIVYVSSDKTIEEYNEYIKNRNWLAVPFDSEQRNQIKRHFSTCAHRELKELGFDRKHEIPTIIIIDSQSQGIITTNGADHVDDMGEAALDHWIDMKRWIDEASNKVA